MEDDMAWVRFTGEFDYHPSPRSTIAYTAGMELSVRRDCADQAVAAGVAEEIPTPARTIRSPINPTSPTKPMSLSAPQSGELRHQLRFEAKVAGENVGGVVTTSWSVLIKARSAKIEATRGGEEVIAGRMQGKAAYDIWVRSDSATRQLTNAHRAVNIRTGEAYTMGQPVDPFGRRQWLLIQATSAGDGDPG